MSDYIDLCIESAFSLEGLIKECMYQDEDGLWYLNTIDGGVDAADVENITDCADTRSTEQLLRLAIVEDINGNPAIQTVAI